MKANPRSYSPMTMPTSINEGSNKYFSPPIRNIDQFDQYYSPSPKQKGQLSYPDSRINLKTVGKYNQKQLLDKLCKSQQKMNLYMAKYKETKKQLNQMQIFLKDYETLNKQLSFQSKANLQKVQSYFQQMANNYENKIQELKTKIQLKCTELQLKDNLIDELNEMIQSKGQNKYKNQNQQKDIIYQKIKSSSENRQQYKQLLAQNEELKLDIARLTNDTKYFQQKYERMIQSKQVTIHKMSEFNNGILEMIMKERQLQKAFSLNKVQKDESSTSQKAFILSKTKSQKNINFNQQKLKNENILMQNEIQHITNENQKIMKENQMLKQILQSARIQIKNLELSMHLKEERIQRMAKMIHDDKGLQSRLIYNERNANASAYTHKQAKISKRQSQHSFTTYEVKWIQQKLQDEKNLNRALEAKLKTQQKKYKQFVQTLDLVEIEFVQQWILSLSDLCQELAISSFLVKKNTGLGSNVFVCKTIDKLKSEEQYIFSWIKKIKNLCKKISNRHNKKKSTEQSTAKLKKPHKLVSDNTISQIKFIQAPFYD